MRAGQAEIEKATRETRLAHRRTQLVHLTLTLALFVLLPVVGCKSEESTSTPSSEEANQASLAEEPGDEPVEADPERQKKEAADKRTADKSSEVQPVEGNLANPDEITRDGANPVGSNEEAGESKMIVPVGGQKILDDVAPGPPLPLKERMKLADEMMDYMEEAQKVVVENKGDCDASAAALKAWHDKRGARMTEIKRELRKTMKEDEDKMRKRFEERLGDVMKDVQAGLFECRDHQGFRTALEGIR